MNHTRKILPLLEKPNYARILRAVGQALDELKVESFQLMADGSDFAVVGRSYLELFAGHQKEVVLEKFCRNLQPARGEEKTIRLRFTPGDISWLTREIRAKRRNLSGVPNVFSTSEFLRIVGHYMDIQRIFLVGLSRNDHFLTLNYETRQGERVLATHPVSFFDDLFIRMCLKRKLPSDPGVLLRSDP
jgi:hypothetical protein